MGEMMSKLGEIEWTESQKADMHRHTQILHAANLIAYNLIECLKRMEATSATTIEVGKDELAVSANDGVGGGVSGVPDGDCSTLDAVMTEISEVLTYGVERMQGHDNNDDGLRMANELRPIIEKLVGETLTGRET